MLARSCYHIQILYKNIVPAKVSYVNILRTCSSNISERDFNYNEADERHILKTLNENSANELTRFNLSKGRIKKLDQWRTKKGKFNSIEDILEVDGFGVKVLDKCCKSILDIRDNKITEVKKSKVNIQKIHNLISPNLSLNESQYISKVVAIHIGVCAVSWCVVQTDRCQMNVIHWGLHDFTKEDKRLHTSQILQLATTITDLIPHGDIYVFESLQQNSLSVSPNHKTFVASMDKVQLLSMISALLANRAVKTNLKADFDKPLNDFGNITYQDFEEKVSPYNQIYYLKSMLPARLYRTVVGSERISTGAVVDDILQKSDKISCVEMPTQAAYPIIIKSLIDLYKSSGPLHKELFGNSLLLGLTCTTICIHRDKECIRRVSFR